MFGRGRGEGESTEIPTSCNSFSPDTLVLIGNGRKVKIKDLRNGDKVEAADPDTGELAGTRSVTATHLNRDTDLVDLTIETSPGHTSTLHTTANHPFWDDTTHQWTPAARLTPGDALNTPTAHHVHVASLHARPGAADMYNLTVDQLHTYYVLAGTTPVLVHNTGPGCGVTPETLDQAWSTWNTSANLEHVIDPEKHGFGDLVASTGGREEALRAILDSLHGATDLPAAGRYEVNRKIAGETVTIRGAVVNGIPRLGTAFIPGKFPGAP
jgi:hypothetical protein